jgi:chemotaxis signal transduction protein
MTPAARDPRSRPGDVDPSTALRTTADPSELNRVFAERARALARADAGESRVPGVPLLSFSHGERRFAVELSSVLRVLRPRRLTRIPNAPRSHDHVFYEDGRIVAALDASALLGAPIPADGTEPILLLGAEGAILGVRATRVLGPKHFELEQLRPPSSDLEKRTARCIRGIASDLTIILDGSALTRTLRTKRRDDR